MSLVQKQSRAVFFDLGMEMQELTMSSTGLSLKTEARQAAQQSPGQAVGKGAESLRRGGVSGGGVESLGAGRSASQAPDLPYRRLCSPAAAAILD